MRELVAADGLLAQLAARGYTVTRAVERQCAAARWRRSKSSPKSPARLRHTSWMWFALP